MGNQMNIQKATLKDIPHWFKEALFIQAKQAPLFLLVTMVVFVCFCLTYELREEGGSVAINYLVLLFECFFIFAGVITSLSLTAYIDHEKKYSIVFLVDSVLRCKSFFLLCCLFLLIVSIVSIFSDADGNDQVKNNLISVLNNPSLSAFGKYIGAKAVMFVTYFEIFLICIISLSGFIYLPLRIFTELSYSEIYTLLVLAVSKNMVVYIVCFLGFFQIIDFMSYNLYTNVLSVFLYPLIGGVIWVSFRHIFLNQRECKNKKAVTAFTRNAQTA